MPVIRNTIVNEDSFINRLIRLGLIERAEVRGRYTLNIDGTSAVRATIIAKYATIHGPNQFTVNSVAAQDASIIRSLQAINRAAQTPAQPQPHPMRPVPIDRPLRLDRRNYHSQGRNIDTALSRLAPDADGVKRSFGLEWEIYSLNEVQEDKLVRLLQTLPPHATERDSSLNETGVEIIFEPMSKETYIKTFKTLQQFVAENNIEMRNTGAHTTYGVSNARVTNSDLQIRLNRLALAFKSVATQQTIRSLFGREFQDYCRLPQSLTEQHHSNAFSASRGTTAWECRMVNYKADVEKVANFLMAAESVFYRPVNISDFVTVFAAAGIASDAA